MARKIKWGPSEIRGTLGGVTYYRCTADLFDGTKKLATRLVDGFRDEAEREKLGWASFMGEDGKVISEVEVVPEKIVPDPTKWAVESVEKIGEPE